MGPAGQAADPQPPWQQRIAVMQMLLPDMFPKAN
jgi:hypothetical protein